MLFTISDHNPSRTELYNNGPNMWMKDVSRFLRQLSFHVFVHFYVIKFESKQFCEIFVVNSLNYGLFKSFLSINLDKVGFFYPNRYPDSVPQVCTQRFQWTRFLHQVILRVKKIISFNIQLLQRKRCYHGSVILHKIFN